MQVYVPAVGVGKRLHDLRLERRVGEEEMGTPHVGRFLPDAGIALPGKPHVHPHVVGALIDARNSVFPASAASCKGNGIANGNS